MKSPLDSNLIYLIRQAIDECFYDGSSTITRNNLQIEAEWNDSRNAGYSVITLCIRENGIVKFVYEDYGTECAN